jgi:hypothetical protein
MIDKFTVVGIEHRSYVSKKTGKDVEGYIFYLTQEAEDKNVIGVRCFSQWLSPDLYTDELQVGSVVVLNYNRFGGVSSAIVVE